MESREILITLAIMHNGDWDVIYNAIQEHEVIEEVEKDNAMSYLEKQGYGALTLLDAEYPEELKHVTKPPFVLFYSGFKSLLSRKKKVAISGSREIEENDDETIGKIVNILPADAVVVNGMQRGVETSSLAHALKYCKDVICVAGSSLDMIYPEVNEELYKKLLSSGRMLVLSEYFKDYKPNPVSMKERQRIIASIANKMIVGRMRYDTGAASNIVERMLIEGKDVYCVPGPFGDEGWAKTNDLLNGGAIPLVNRDSIKWEE